MKGKDEVDEDGSEEESKTKEKMAPPTKVLVEPSHTNASSEVEKQNPKVEARLTKANGTENLDDNDAGMKIRAVSNVGMEKFAFGSTDDGCLMIPTKDILLIQVVDTQFLGELKGLKFSTGRKPKFKQREKKKKKEDLNSRTSSL